MRKIRFFLAVTVPVLLFILIFQMNIGLIGAASEPSCSLSFNPPAGPSGFSASFNWTSANDADNRIPYSCSGNIGSGYLETAAGSGAITVNENQTCTLTVVNSDNLLRTCQASVSVVVDSGDDRIITALIPQTAVAGRRVKIIGNNLHPNIYLSGNSGDLDTIIGTISTDRKEVTFMVPASLARGSYMVKVGPNTIDVSNELPLTISNGAGPIITLVSPNNAIPGQQVKIYGSNLSGEIQLKKGAQTIQVTGIANDTLSEVAFDVPLDIVSGDYSITVVTPDGNAVTPPTFKIKTGGDNFRNPRVIGAPTEGLPTDLGQLIQQIFTWALMLLGIAVFVSFFYAGFLYLTAAGNTSNVGAAKTRMTNAILGAIILLSSYLILNTINPDLVENTFNLPGLGVSKNTSTPGEACQNPEPFPVDSLLGDLQAERANYGAELTHEEAGELLNAVAWANKDEGWGLLSKPGGNNCPIPDGSLISCDYLVHQPSLLGLDALVAAPGTKEDGTPENGASTPTWGNGCKVKPGEFLAPVQP